MIEKDIIKNKYEIIKKINKGFLSDTFLIQDIFNKNKFILKYTNIKKYDTKIIRIFEKEFSLLSNLSNKNIPKVIEYFSIEKDNNLELFIINEYIEGQNLYELIKSGKYFNEKEVINILDSIIEVLDYLHSFSPPILHRDIKPQNIMYSKNNNIYLIDFGASKEIILNNENQSLSTIIGTQSYMPIEQFQGKCLPSSDIYSLGLTIIYLLSHKEPFSLDKKGLKYYFEKDVNISKGFTKILNKMIDPDFSKRYSSVKELKSDLDNLKSGKNNFDKKILFIPILILIIIIYSYESKKETPPKTEIIKIKEIEKNSNTKIIGTIYFDEKLISEITDIKPKFWFRNEDKNIIENPKVVYSNSKFTIDGLSEGNYGMSISIDANEINPMSYPGDFRKWITFSVKNDNVQELQIEMEKLIHLNSPQDNNYKIEKWGEKCDKYSINSPVNFSWDKIEEDIYYDYSVSLINCEPYNNKNIVYSGTTKDNFIKLELPKNENNEYYLFNLYARKKGNKIGSLMTHGSNGHGWDYRFRVIN